MSELKAPFPWFGGKSRVAHLVWPRFGGARNYVEPFAGSLACLLGRPTPFDGTETVNDIDGFIANFWRAIKADPEAVAHFTDWPVNENDLHARHAWLIGQIDGLVARLEGDPEYFDAKVAGWWAWGICCWIGGGFCSGDGPWQSVEVDGVRRLVHLSGGRGVKRQRVHLGNAGQGVCRNHDGLIEWLQALADRLRHVRVCCGDWSRVCGLSPTVNLGLTAVFLDPPYAGTANRDPRLYRKDSLSVAHDVREWAIEHGDDPLMRIALCGYEGEHEMPDSWDRVEWMANGGYSMLATKKERSKNRENERIWFSPHCVRVDPKLPLMWDAC